MSMILIDLPYPPSLNAMYRSVVIGGRARTLLTKQAREYKKTVEGLCLAKRIRPLSGDLILRIVAHRPQKRGDLDNLLKIACDSLQGFCYENDSQIVAIHAWRREDKYHPRLEVTVCPSAPTI